MTETRHRVRQGFTVLEVTVALGLFAVAIVVVAQIAIWSLAERRQSTLRHEVLESAANILESAQATPWEELTPAWATAQRLPDALAQRLAAGKLTVRVEADPARPPMKRVSVDISWQLDDGKPARPVVLTALFGPRSVPTKGGQP